MRRFAAVFLPLAVIFALALWRMQGPEPKPASASGFSAVRAKDTLHALLAENVPHPIGTPANARVRDRIVERLRAMQYDVTVQRRFACNAYATCGMVENILARQPGGRHEDVVLLTAHYDSVGAGPGASDDGVGVATILDVASVIRGRRFRNPVAILITDGEEAGLLGAEAFVADAALAKEVGVVINTEMRGTYGPSNMFETSRGNRWLIRHLANGLERPQATSLFYSIYNLLPNDTDVTIFKREGLAAINFAAIRGVSWYHTPYDDVAHANGNTLQHHGDNVLGAVRALANADLGARSHTDATYFDILAFTLVWWPQEWTPWIGVLGLVLLIAGARRVPPREMTFGVLAAFTAIVLAALLGTGVSWLARVRSEGASYVANPETSIAAMWLTGIACALIAAALFRRRSQPRAMLYGVAIVWLMIGIALALTIPGAAFLLIVPAFVVALCAVANLGELATSVIASCVAAILLFPMALVLYDALGGPMMAAIAILLGILATLFAPLFANLRAGVALLILGVVCAGIAMLQPAYTSERPRRVSISHIDDKGSRWVAPFAVAPQFQPYEDDVRGLVWAAPAPPVAPRVAMTATREGEKLVVHVRTSRGANRMTLVLKGDAKILRVNGVEPPPRPARFSSGGRNDWHVAVANAVPEMIVECSARGRIEGIASDMTFGAADAPKVPGTIGIQDGNATITRARGSW